MLSLQKNQNKWSRMSRILGREGANVRVSGTLFKAVDQAVILFGSKTWVMNPCMGWAGVGGGSAYGGLMSHRKANAASLVRKLVLPPFGGIGAGGGL